MKNSLQNYAEEIEHPETTWRRVRDIFKALREGGVEPGLVEAAIGVIHNETEERLLLKRAPDDRSYPNTWCFPGGRRDFLKKKGEVDEKEPLELTVRRETFEETGLQTEIERKIAVRRAVHIGKSRVYIVHSYLLNVLGDPNAVRLSHEHVEYGYFSRDKAPEGIGTVTRAMLHWDPRGKV